MRQLRGVPMKRSHVVVILALVMWTVGCYKCAFPDCRERPIPPEPDFYKTRARDAGGG